MSLTLAILTDLIAVFVLAYGLYFRRHRGREPIGAGRERVACDPGGASPAWPRRDTSPGVDAYTHRPADSARAIPRTSAATSHALR